MSGAGGDLTIVLTLKDRAPYTRRWMEYANERKFPFKVLVADGGSDDSVQAMLADRTRFPDVDYEYVRYPEDRCYADYYAKMADAASRVGTPFIALADNDDFLLPDALGRAMGFLADHPGYASCGGQSVSLWVLPGNEHAGSEYLYGRRVEWKCTREPDALAGSSARERLRAAMLSKADMFYYDVRRTGQVQRNLRVIRDLGLSDLFLVECMVLCLTAISGRTKRLEEVFLARQRNSPGSSGVVHRQAHGDWFGRMLAPSWSRDFHAFVDAVSGLLAEADGIATEESRAWVMENYRAWVVPSLLTDLLDDPVVSFSMSGILPAARRLVRLPESSVLRKTAKALYRRLPWVSVDVVHGLELFTRPVRNAGQDIQPIRDFLRRGDSGE